MYNSSLFHSGGFLCKHFSSLTELEHFTHSLNTPSSDHACRHCGQYDQWVSHGYVYKNSPTKGCEAVGKRVICTNRYGRSGCGRTQQLYLAHVIPNRQYRLTTVMAFIQGLLKGALVEQAYLHAIGCATKEARHAWRWLTALYRKLPQWRILIAKPVETFRASQRSERVNILLPTVEKLFGKANPSSIDAFQYQYQRAFF